MKSLFPDEYRMVSERELKYQVSNRRETAEDENLTFEDFIETLTPARKAMAMALIELYKRSRNKEMEQVRSSCDVYEYMKELSFLDHEESWAVYLNQDLRVIRKCRISSGGIAATVVDVRIVLREALKCNAVAMFLVHNHPSGSLIPSSQDNSLTNRVRESADVMSIRLLDHVIIAGESYYSYADEGRI